MIRGTSENIPHSLLFENRLCVSGLYSEVSMGHSSEMFPHLPPGSWKPMWGT